MTGDNNVNNTGFLGYTTLEKYYTDNGAATGQTKPNVDTDPDYIPLTYNTTTCPLPYYSVVYYNSYADAFNNVGGTAINVYSSLNSYTEAARLYTDQARTIAAPLKFYKRLGEIRSTSLVLYDGLSATRLGAIASPSNSCITKTTYFETANGLQYSFALTFAIVPKLGFNFNVTINGNTSGASSSRNIATSEIQANGTFNGDTINNNGITYVPSEAVTVIIQSFSDGAYNHVQC